LIGLLAISIWQPFWSPWGFARVFSVPQEAGAILAYALAVAWMGCEVSRLGIALRFVPIFMIPLICYRGGWLYGSPLLIPMLATTVLLVLCRHWRKLRWKELGFALLLGVVINFRPDGIVYLNQGLLTRASQAGANDLAEYIRFLLSPLFLGTAAAAGLMSLFGDRFALHEWRRLVQADKRRLELSIGALLAAYLGLVDAKMLTVAIVLGIAGYAVFVHDALSDVT
jgi:hypothetical protein